MKQPLKFNFSKKNSFGTR